ncbi:MAG: metallophosphoesterase [Spirochaetes bacterium]|nr:metallophosphoesterase [Spirochaetota bacterium]MBU1079187.1 metallophosphoesterase [Spirochaetota bacterium]
MRILVVSDTHGDYRSLAAALKLLGRSVQALLHLGDGSGDVRSAARSGSPMPPAYGVRGNVDSDSSMPLLRRFDADGRLVMIAHGHRYPLGEGTSCLSHAAREAGARAFFFGHTHVPHYEERGGVAILNPGSLSRPRGPWGPSLAIVEAPPSSSCLDVKLYELVGTSSSPRLRAIRF